MEQARLTSDEGFQSYDLGRCQEAANRVLSDLGSLANGVYTSSENSLSEYQRNWCKQAGEKLRAANEIARSPTLALCAARALLAQGRFVEAAEQYDQAFRLPASGVGRQRASQEESQREAPAEREQLLRMTPQIVVTVQGSTSSDLRVTLDGTPIPAESLGRPLPVDPGTRTVVARSGNQQVIEELTLTKREHKAVTLHFDSAQPTATLGGRHGLPSIVPFRAPTRSVDTTAPRGTGFRRELGWALVSLGGAGLGVGLATGLAAVARTDTLYAEGCNAQGHCFDEQASDVKSYMRLRTISLVGYAVGAVSLGIGGTMILLDESSKRKTKTPLVSTWLGPASVAVKVWLP